MRLVEVDLSQAADHVTQPCVLPSLWAATEVRNLTAGLIPTDAPVDFFMLLFVVACVILACVIFLVVAVTCPPHFSSWTMKSAQDPRRRTRALGGNRVRRNDFSDEGESQERCVFIEDSSECQEDTNDATLVNAAAAAAAPCSSLGSTASKSTTTNKGSTVTSRSSFSAGSQQTNLHRSCSLAASSDMRPRIKESKRFVVADVNCLDFEGGAQRDRFSANSGPAAQVQNFNERRWPNEACLNPRCLCQQKFCSMPTKNGKENPRPPSDYVDKDAQLREYVDAQSRHLEINPRRRLEINPRGRLEINPPVLFYQGESPSGTQLEDFDSIASDGQESTESRVYRLPSFSQSTINPVESCDGENWSQTPQSIALASCCSHSQQAQHQRELRKSSSSETVKRSTRRSPAEPDVLRTACSGGGSCPLVSGSEKLSVSLLRSKLQSKETSGRGLGQKQTQQQRIVKERVGDSGGNSQPARLSDGCAHCRPHDYASSTLTEPHSQTRRCRSDDAGEAKREARGRGDIPSASDLFGLQRESLPSHIRPRERYKLEDDWLQGGDAERATSSQDRLRRIRNEPIPHTRSERSMDSNYVGGSLDLNRRRRDRGSLRHSLQYSGSWSGQARNSLSDKLVRQKYLLRSETPKEVNSQENEASSSQERGSSEGSSQSTLSGVQQSRNVPVTRQPLPRQPVPHHPHPHQPLPHQPLPHQPLPRQPLTRQPLPHHPHLHQPLPHQPLPHQPLPHEPLPHQSVAHQPLPRPSSADDDDYMDMTLPSSRFPPGGSHASRK